MVAIIVENPKLMESKMRTRQSIVDESSDSSIPTGTTSNDDKCLLCYGPHTFSSNDKGPNFELKDLKEILSKSFSIQFLPQWTQFGRVHMCSKCHQEFLKVKDIYDEFIEVEKRFDAVREKFAFMVVDSIFKSDYISNYVHGNAFDAFRYLVFKEWSERFKKQPDYLKKSDPQELNGKQQEEQKHEKEVTGIMKDLPPPPPTKNSQKVNNKIQNNSSVEKEITPKKSVESANSTKKESSEEKQQQPQKKSNPPPLSVAVKEDAETLMPNLKIELTAGRTLSSSKPTTIESKQCGTKLQSSEEKDSPAAALSTQKLNTPKVKPSGVAEEEKVAPAGSTVKSVKPTQKRNTIVFSHDGQLVSAARGQLPLAPNHKVIFVKRDPITGKMVQVNSPKLNGDAMTLINDQLSGSVNVLKKSSTPANTSMEQQRGKTGTPTVAPVSKITSEKGVGGNTVGISANTKPPVPMSKPQQYPTAEKKKQVRVVQRTRRNIPLTTEEPEDGGSPAGPKIISVTSAGKPSSNNAIITTPAPTLKDVKNQCEFKKLIEATVLAKFDEIAEAEKKASTTAVKVTTSASNGTKHSELKPSEGKDSVQVQKDKILHNESSPSPPPRTSAEPATSEVNAEKGSAVPVVSPLSESRSGRRRTMKRVFDPSSWASGQEMDKLVSQYVKGGLKNKNSPKRVRTDPRQKSLEPEGGSAEVDEQKVV